MKRADKYPLIDPRLPRLYSRILEAANELRASRSIDNSLHHAEVRAKRIESLQPWALREAALEAELSKNRPDDPAPTLAKLPEPAATS
jgi:hypothetical protein